MMETNLIAAMKERTWMMIMAPNLSTRGGLQKQHLLSISKVCKFPAFCVSIDEQKKKFKGRSGQTFQTKNKPISEGYKFWAVCCVNSGHCYHFIPTARTGNVEGRKIIDSVLLLLEKLPLKSRRYVAMMDNLFALSKVLSGARVMNVAICGTARAR